MNKITRFELIMNGERKIILKHKDLKFGDKEINKITYDLQDNNQTLKIFIEGENNE